MSLVWKSRPSGSFLPLGWYWVRMGDGRESVLHASDARTTKAVAWAGPIPRPKEPSEQQLATVRYKLDGSYLPPRIGGFGQYDWDIMVDRAEMLRRAKVHLCGDAHYYETPVVADSSDVTLLTSRRLGGRWGRATWEKFTATNIDAAITKCAPAAAVPA